ncbi:hypothetical protein Aduo_018829 [Ancylostoma duodenale]
MQKLGTVQRLKSTKFQFSAEFEIMAFQMVGCNIVLLILGLAAAGLAGSQFSNVRIYNYRNIDLRLLNWIHALTGAIGLYVVAANHGAVAAKTLYCGRFLRDQTLLPGELPNSALQIVEDHDNLNSQQSDMRLTNGFLNNFDGYYPERIVISALMIADGFLAALAALICIILLRKLVILSVPAYPIQLTDRSRSAQDYNKTLASVALIKLVFGVGALGLAVFIEYEHEKVDGTDKYIKIALEHIAAMLAIMSSIIDIFASRERRIEQINLLVKIRVLEWNWFIEQCS